MWRVKGATEAHLGAVDALNEAEEAASEAFKRLWISVRRFGSLRRGAGSKSASKRKVGSGSASKGKSRFESGSATLHDRMFCHQWMNRLFFDYCMSALLKTYQDMQFHIRIYNVHTVQLYKNEPVNACPHQRRVFLAGFYVYLNAISR